MGMRDMKKIGAYKGENKEIVELFYKEGIRVGDDI